MAKQIKTAYPGRKMEVEVSVGGWSGEVTVGGWGGDSKLTFVEWLKSREVMLKFKEDANVVITNQEVQ